MQILFLGRAAQSRGADESPVIVVVDRHPDLKHVSLATWTLISALVSVDTSLFPVFHTELLMALLIPQAHSWTQPTHRETTNRHLESIALLFGNMETTCCCSLHRLQVWQTHQLIGEKHNNSHPCPECFYVLSTWEPCCQGGWCKELSFEERERKQKE